MFSCTCGFAFATVQQRSNHRRSSTCCGSQDPAKRPRLDTTDAAPFLGAQNLAAGVVAGQWGAVPAAGLQESGDIFFGNAPSLITIDQPSRFEPALDGYESPLPMSAGNSEGNIPLQDQSCSSAPIPQAFDSSKALLDFLTNACQGRGFSNSDIDWLLGIIFHPHFDREELEFRNSIQFRKFQDGLQAIQSAMAALQLDGLVPDEKGWYSRNMRQEGDHQDLIFRWRNPVELVRKLYGNKRFRGSFKVYARPIYNKDGKRCVTDAASADWWLRFQERIDGLVAAVALYSDPTAVSSDMTITGWPVTLTIRNIGPSVRHRGEYAILVGIVCQLEELPEYGFIASSRAFKERRSTLMWQCETQLLAVLKAASARGVYMRDPWGVLRKVFPGLHSYSCDLQEAYKLGVVKTGRCLDCLVPAEELNDLEGRWPERTEAFMGRVVTACTAALEERRPGVVGRVADACDKAGMSLPIEGCLWNWYEGLDLPDDVRDSYRALVPDTLHGIDLGVWIYLVDGIRDWAKGQYTRQLAAIKLRTVDARLRGMPRESGFRLPMRKGVYMEKKKTYKGYEQRNMMQVFVFAIIGLFKQANGREPFVELIVQFLDWYMQLTRRNLPKYHTKDSLRKTDKLGIKFGRSAVRFLSGVQKSDFKTAKFHHIPLYTKVIQARGLTSETSCEEGEGSHGRTSKKAYQASNKKNTGEQVMRFNQRRQNVAEYVEGCNTSRRGLRIRRRVTVTALAATEKAARQKKHVLAATRVPLRWEWLRPAGQATYPRFPAPGSRAGKAILKRIAHQYSDLQHLERCTRVFLAGGLQGVRGDAALLHNLPDCQNSEIRVAKHAAIAPGRGSRFQKHVSIAHADPEFHKKPYYSNVAVLAADGSEWYANVRLLFSLTDQRGRNRNLVFLRYLEEYRVPDATTCKRLSWAKYVHRGQQVDEWYDVVELKSILRTVYLVKDWNREGGFYLNRFKWSSEKRYKGTRCKSE